MLLKSPVYRLQRLTLFRLIIRVIRLKSKKLTMSQKLKKLEIKLLITISILPLQILIDFQVQYLIKDQNKQNQQQLLILTLLNNALSKIRKKQKNYKNMIKVTLTMLDHKILNISTKSKTFTMPARLADIKSPVTAKKMVVIFQN